MCQSVSIIQYGKLMLDFGCCERCGKMVFENVNECFNDDITSDD